VIFAVGSTSWPAQITSAADPAYDGRLLSADPAAGPG